MSDLINREKLLNNIMTRVCTVCNGDDCKVTDCLQAVIEALEEQAEHVIRCRECRYWMPCTAKHLKSNHICGLSGYLIGENGFCLYGHKKG